VCETKPGKSRIGTNTHAATVLVKVIAVSRDSEDDQRRYSHLVSEIVSATNRQNAIGQVHLKSNDIEQIRLERDLKKLEGTMSIYGLNFERHRPETVELPRTLANVPMSKDCYPSSRPEIVQAARSW
jgi:hypothetical protein